MSLKWYHICILACQNFAIFWRKPECDAANMHAENCCHHGFYGSLFNDLKHPCSHMWIIGILIWKSKSEEFHNIKMQFAISGFWWGSSALIRCKRKIFQRELSHQTLVAQACLSKFRQPQERWKPSTVLHPGIQSLRESEFSFNSLRWIYGPLPSPIFTEYVSKTWNMQQLDIRNSTSASAKQWYNYAPFRAAFFHIHKLAILLVGLNQRASRDCRTNSWICLLILACHQIRYHHILRLHLPLHRL